jgi:hypothetical protein
MKKKNKRDILYPMQTEDFLGSLLVGFALASEL